MATATNMITVSTAYAVARKTYLAAVREAIRAVEPAELDAGFWEAIDRMATRAGWRGREPGKAAAEGALWQILSDGDWTFAAFERAAAFVNAYEALASKLHDKCFEMPGVEKGDDSYGDWTDALPVAGRKVVEGILADDLANYKQVCAAVAEARPAINELISNGENYFRMRLEDWLLERWYNAREVRDATREEEE